MQLSGAQAIVKCLEGEGVEYVFGMVGHGNLAFFDALHDSQVKLISMPHEQLAVHAADAYFRTSHKPGVITTTIGPGLANTVNAVMDAMQDSSALIILAGGTPSAYVGWDSYQEVSLHIDASQAEVLRPIVKRVWQVRHPQMLMQAISRAFNYALSGTPGPVLVDIAFDLYAYVRDFDLPDTKRRRATSRRIQGSQSEVRRAAELLWNAERPLIYAGNGVLLSEAAAEVQRAAEYLAAPVATTMTAPDVLRSDHPLYGGFTGVVGTPTGNWLAQNTDVVLALGTRFGEMDTNSWRSEYFFPVPNAKIIQVDIEPTEIGKIYETEVGIIGDIKAVLNQLLNELPQLGETKPKTRSNWYCELEKRRDEWRSTLRDAQNSQATPIEIAPLIHTVREALPDDGYIVGGIGPRHAVVQQFSMTMPGSCIVNNGHGTMGFGPPAAVGIKLAHPDKAVVALVGDGEFRSVSQILAPAVEYGINVIWVILNNYGFNIIELYQKRHYERVFGTEFIKEDTGAEYNPDFVKMAEAYGAQGLRVHTVNELRNALDLALDARSPFVIEAIVTRTPRIMGTGQWDANRLLPLGHNLE